MTARKPSKPSKTSQRLPPSSPPSSDQDDELEVTEAAESTQKEIYWKRKYNKVIEDRTKSDDKPEEIPLVKLGRGIYRIGYLDGKISHVIDKADKLTMLEEDADLVKDDFKSLKPSEVEELKRDWERSATGLAELFRFLPNFQRTIDNKETGELSLIYKQLDTGAKAGRSDDMSRIKGLLATWLNEGTPTPNPLLTPQSREGRGLNHDLIGRLLCPVEFDWDNLEVRTKLRAADDAEFDIFSSFHASVFYRKFKGTKTNLEYGFLMSPLLVRVFKAIFTAPSSAADPVEEPDSDVENEPAPKKQKMSRSRNKAKAAQRKVSSILNMNDHVTPRSIAYVAVLLHFNLQTGERWNAFYGGFDYHGLYNYIVDYFEDVPSKAAKERVRNLLRWWDKQVFPDAAHCQSNTAHSRNAMKQQRAACSSTLTSRALASARSSASAPARPSASRSNGLSSSTTANSATWANSAGESSTEST